MTFTFINLYLTILLFFTKWFKNLICTFDPLLPLYSRMFIFTFSHISPGLPWWLRWSRICLQCGRPGLILGLGRSPGGQHGNPLQYSCLENPHRQRNLEGYNPWGRKESDTMTDQAQVTVVKSPPAPAGDVRDAGSIPGSGRFPWRRKWQPTPVFFPGESYGQRSLVGYSP